tara:strand:+ start:743 stop:1147 length:405 start_codon:yes stop_codon:yes gene_type:complete
MSVYKITSPQTDKVYVGSTTQPLSYRFTNHKFHKNSSSKEITKYDDCSIELIEEVPIDQILIRERYWIETLDSVNINIPNRTTDEIKEYRTSWRREYNNNNRGITPCPCGGKYTYGHQPRHLRSIKHIQYLNNK